MQGKVVYFSYTARTKQWFISNASSFIYNEFFFALQHMQLSLQTPFIIEGQ